MEINRRRLLASLAGTVPIAAAGCSGGGVESTVASVTVKDGSFSNCNVFIDKEGRVVWENKGETTCLITSASSNWSFESKLEPGAGTQKQFDSADVYTAAVSKEGSSKKNKMKIGVGKANIEEKIDSC